MCSVRSFPRVGHGVGQRRNQHQCGSASDDLRIVTFCVAAGDKETLWKKYRATSGELRSRRAALYFYGKFPVWVKMWVNELYDAKEGRTSDRGSPSRCALSLS